jgi:phospholipid transport system substrate-binding protein
MLANSRFSVALLRLPRILLVSLTALLLAGGIDSAYAQAPIDTGAPDALVSSLSQDILATVRADPSIRQASSGRLDRLVRQKILPYADFERTTRLAMGRGWRDATPSQRSELVEQFESLLIHTYAGATAQIGDQQVSVKPWQPDPEQGDDQRDAVVRTQVIQQGQVYPVDYRLARVGTQWRIYDVNVLGVWLIQAYRQQFTDVLSRSGVAGLINFLTERNRQLSGRTQE